MEFTDILKVKGVKAKGFGIIPKLVMLDARLTIEAKAIYSYFCSYAGAGDTVFPSRDKIVTDLGISINRFYKHFNLLKEYGYIEIERNKADGKFDKNIYYLIENPADILTEKEIKSPCIQNEYMEGSPCIHFAYMENEYTNNNKSFINNNNNYINQSISLINKDIKNTTSSNESQEQNNNNLTDGLTDNINNVCKTIRYRLKIDDLIGVYPDDKDLIDEIVGIVYDMYFSDYVVIGGQRRPQELIRAAIMRLNYFNVEELVNKFKTTSRTTEIKNVKAYMQSMIYNIAFESELSLTNKIKYNFG